MGLTGVEAGAETRSIPDRPYSDEGAEEEVWSGVPCPGTPLCTTRGLSVTAEHVRAGASKGPSRHGRAQLLVSVYDSDRISR